MYFNLFTPFIVADPGRAGQRLVTAHWARQTASCSSILRRRMVMWSLCWVRGGHWALWCKRWERQSANQSFELVQTPSHHHKDFVWSLKVRTLRVNTDPPLTVSACLSSKAWPGQLASVFIEMLRAPGACQTCHQLTCKKYQLGNTFNISNFQQSQYSQGTTVSMQDNWQVARIDRERGEDCTFCGYLTLFTEFSKNWECFPEFLFVPAAHDWKSRLPGSGTD